MSMHRPTPLKSLEHEHKYIFALVWLHRLKRGFARAHTVTCAHLCNGCEVFFVHTMLFQRHAQDLHWLESCYRLPL